MPDGQVCGQSPHRHRFKRTGQAAALALTALLLPGCGSSRTVEALHVGDDRRITVALGYGPTVAVRARLVGALGANAWIFTAAHAGGAPARPPIVFLHDWGSTDPTAHGPWIGHLVRRGETVIFPIYQTGQGDDPARARKQGAAGIRNAIDVLGVRPTSAAYVGYGVGGALAADLAAGAAHAQLPAPRVVVAVYPSRVVRQLLIDAAGSTLPRPAREQLPSGTPLFALAGEHAGAESRRTAERLASAAGPGGRFQLVIDPRVSERTGPLQTDGVARRTFWRLLDAAIEPMRRPS